MKFTSTINNRFGLNDFIVLFSLSSATTKLKNLDILLQGEADHSKQACIMAKYSQTLIALVSCNRPCYQLQNLES